LWASTNPTECIKDDLFCGIKRDPQTLERMSKLVETLVKRYPFIRYWEFWNEPERWLNIGQKDISDYAFFLRVFYDAVKRADPTVLVAATTEVGPIYAHWLYQYSDSVWGKANRPWDAIAYHPYNNDAIRDPTTGRKMSIRKERIDQLYRLMVDFGDSNKPIWLTEVGWGDPPEDQAFYVVDAFNFINTRPFVTLVSVHMLHDWEGEQMGLLRVEPETSWQRPLQKGDKFVPKPFYYNALRDYSKRILPPEPILGEDKLVFRETQHTVRDAFRKAWLKGGLSLYGYPRTGQFYEANPNDGKYYLVQYFERVRMEYHPEYKGTDNEVLFGLLGNQILKERGWLDQNGNALTGVTLPETKPVSLPANSRWFGETGHLVSGLFLQSWERNGGLAVLGFPKTRVFEEQNPETGQLYQVQYFERARMELHPATANAPAFVAFGLLGNDRLRLQNRLLPDNKVNQADYYNPALPEFSNKA
jgi:hypothetical protein